MERLSQTLQRIDGRSYNAYKELRGEYRFDGHTLHIDHVQGDPFAAPSRIAVVVDADRVGLPHDLLAPRARRIATEDFLTRRVAQVLPRVCRGDRGSGKSGRVIIDQPGQEVLERTSCLIDRGAVELRLEVGLPASGRRVLGRQAAAIFFDELPELCRRALNRAALDLEALRRHADVVEDQQALRGRLEELGLVAFVGEGAVLPRRSGVDDRPLEQGAIPFGPLPARLAVTVALPHAGAVSGLGIPAGVTLIVGGGYHGKSTLLEALTRGIYDHIPGDGRERVVARRQALPVRAEDGRRVAGVGIDAFIRDLPGGRDTEAFTTDRASGSTSQAAAIMEALEAGSDLLLLDEDTSASNFLVRDYRMQRLVPRGKEPIRPFVDRVQTLHRELGVSTIMVLGGSSDYFEVADEVIQMDAYRPLDVTSKVAEIMAELPSARVSEVGAEPVVVRARRPKREGLNPVGRRGRTRSRARATRAIQFGEEEIDISLMSQIVCPSQARALADALVLVSERWADGRTVAEMTAALRTLIHDEGLLGIAEPKRGDRASVRGIDVVCAMNRLRSLQIETH